MQNPPEKYRADANAERPDFDTLDDPAAVVRQGHTRDKIYTTVLQLTEPATVADIADRSEVGSDATRQYLRWFEDMGLVHQVSDHPEKYVRNQDYLRWRRANQLAKNYRVSALVDRLQTVTEDIETYRSKYECQSPADVVIAEVATDRDTDIADVWQDVSAWETAETRRTVLEKALRMRRDNDVEDSRGSNLSRDGSAEANP